MEGVQSIIVSLDPKQPFAGRSNPGYRTALVEIVGERVNKPGPVSRVDVESGDTVGALNLHTKPSYRIRRIKRIPMQQSKRGCLVVAHQIVLFQGVSLRLLIAPK